MAPAPHKRKSIPLLLMLLLVSLLMLFIFSLSPPQIPSPKSNTCCVKTQAQTFTRTRTSPSSSKSSPSKLCICWPDVSCLARSCKKGHPVIDASHFSDVINLAKSITFHDSTAELVKEILVSAYVTRKSLDLGYSTWVLEGNMLPRTSDSFYDSFDSGNDVFIGKTSGLIFVRSSSLTLKIWADDFVYKIVSLFDALLKDSVTHDRIMLDVIEKLLEQQRIRPILFLKFLARTLTIAKDQSKGIDSALLNAIFMAIRE